MTLGPQRDSHAQTRCRTAATRCRPAPEPPPLPRGSASSELSCTRRRHRHDSLLHQPRSRGLGVAVTLHHLLALLVLARCSTALRCCTRAVCCAVGRQVCSWEAAAEAEAGEVVGLVGRQRRVGAAGCGRRSTPRGAMHNTC